MESKIMQIFYGNDCLPYKDRERQVHYPITGNAFSGASLTTEIRFYVRDIGGVDGITWIANAKRADGKIAYKQLSATHDDDVNEYYVSLQLSQWFTEKKGDLFIALNGYGGGVDIEVDEDSGLYTVSGTPIIQATGSVKITIAYAPIMNNGYGSVPLVSVQEALGVVSSKLDKNSTKYIKLIDSLDEINSSSNSEYLNEGDIIAVRDDGASRLELLKLTGNYPNFDYEELAIYIEYGYFNDITITSLTVDNNASLPSTGDLSFNEEGHTLSWLLDQKSDKSNTYTKTQVDDLIESVRTNEITLVNTTTYPTLSSFLSSTGQEGIIYLYPIENEQNSYYQYIWENNSWLSLGTTNFDFTQYYTKTETDTLLNAKENVSNKTTSITNSSTNTQYPSAKAVYDLTQDIREVAEGKCQTFVLSYEETVASIKSQLHETIDHVYLIDATIPFSQQTPTEITSDISDGYYDSGYSIVNSAFNSQATDFDLGTEGGTVITPAIMIFEHQGSWYFALLEDSGWFKFANIGDIFLVKETEVPDRWANRSSFWKLETSKIDLTNYYTKNTSLVPSSAETYDLGSSSYTFKDLYLMTSINFDDSQDGVSGSITNDDEGLHLYHNTGYVKSILLAPETANTYDLGAPSLTWKDLYLSNKIIIKSVDTSDNAGIELTNVNNNGWFINVNQYGDLRFTYNTTSCYTMTNSSFRPVNTTPNKDIGNSSYKWRDIYFAGNLKGGATLTQAQYDALVSGGTVDSDTFYFIEEE